MKPDRILDVAVLAARNAGAVMRESFGRKVEVDAAEHHDIKLRVDKLCETEILRTISSSFPRHSFVTEETSRHDPGGDSTWIIDPLDGTVNFAYGVPHFCSSIAFRDHGALACAVIYDPVLDELFHATLGCGAFLNDNPIRVSTRALLEEAISSGGFAKSQRSINEGGRDFLRMAAKLRKIRLTGSAALDMAYVAAGRFDAYLERDMSIWDIAAGTLLIREAGGRVAVREISDNAQHYNVLGTNALIHDKLASFLNIDLSSGKDVL
ncbi:MAG: inositol monophosphatase family protein [Planctomycetota bacterium]